MIMSNFFVLILCRRLFCQSFPNPMYLFINYMPNVYLNGKNCIKERTSIKQERVSATSIVVYVTNDLNHVMM